MISNTIYESQVDLYSFIVRGMVVKRDSVYQCMYYTFKFLISTHYESYLSDSIVVNASNIQSTDCGLGVGVNEEWLMFASNFKGRLTTSICTRSKEILEMPDTTRFTAPPGFWKTWNQEVNADLEFLDAKFKSNISNKKD